MLVLIPFFLLLICFSMIFYLGITFTWLEIFDIFQLVIIITMIVVKINHILILSEISDIAALDSPYPDSTKDEV